MGSSLAAEPVGQESYIIRAGYATFIEDPRIIENSATTPLADSLVAGRYTLLPVDLPRQKSL